ncbi:MAG TPA: hypothetical protein VFJ23_05420 [Candidatus Nitrosotalea sp.]|nr:hypothetical protein [Candidatus Nitrosotalea sp.]
MSLRIITSLNRKDSKIFGIGINEYGKNSYLDLKDVYENQAKIFDDIKYGRKDKSEKPIYVLWTDEEFGYFMVHVDRKDDGYELHSRTGNIDHLLASLPDYKTSMS